MISCLVLSHGKVAEAHVEACGRILGECNNLYTLGCDDLTPKALCENITHLIETRNLKDGLFIFVSLRGGSCWNAAARVAREYDKVELISGLNLPLVLSFVSKNAKYSFEDLGDVLMHDANRGIARLAHSGS